jgi:hypothetical protein
MEKPVLLFCMEEILEEEGQNNGKQTKFQLIG